MVKRRASKLRVASVVVVALTAVAVQAGMYNLTDETRSGIPGADQVTINNALFRNCNQASTGTGVIDSFLRIQHNGTEQGYNTDGDLQYNEKTGFTHSLQLSAVPIVNIGGTDYREFLLDINQENNHPLLSLDALQIYQADVGNRTGPIGGFGTPRYSLGSDNWILLDYSLNDGSGSGDLFAYIPNSVFGSGEFVYLYSKFGAHSPYTANDRFEEWAVRTPDNTVVPVPAGLILGLLGLTAAGWKLRKFA